MGYYEVEKAVLIPLIPGDIWRKDGKDTAQLWLPVGRSHFEETDGREELRKFREWNAGRGFHYRLVEIVEDIER